VTKKSTLIWCIALVSITGIALIYLLLLNAKKTDEADFVLDLAGCAAAKRFGETVEIEDGICTIRASHGDFHSIELKSGGRISKDHVVGVQKS
jgi:hypothetical protein